MDATQMHRLEITLRAVTPMFLGGASEFAPSEVRAPSVKGGLRFWYRAIDPDFGKQVNAANANSFSWEQTLLGSSDAGQSGVLVRVSRVRAKHGAKGDGRWDRTMTAYLGYGPITRDRNARRSQTTRAYLESGTEFVVTLLFKPTVGQESRRRIGRALWALVTLGGLGARSRKGFGSVQVLDVSGSQDPTLTWKFRDRAALVASLRGFVRSLPRAAALPEHTMWSAGARCVVVAPESRNETRSGEGVLEWLGRQMHRYRSFRGEERSPIAEADHNIMLTYLKTGTIGHAPRRSAFGLPHNYFFTKSLPNVRAEVNLMNEGSKGRRASPLLLHVQGLEDGTFCAVATFMPARLIPEGRSVEVSGRGQAPRSVQLDDDFSAVSGFIQRLITKGEEIRP